jgi:hypothetical protein
MKMRPRLGLRSKTHEVRLKTEKQTYFEVEVVVAVNLLLMLVDSSRSLKMKIFTL